ncbi:MAG: cbb3-type cytochrome c oxidase subunit I, partial [Burkholderiaceae bacterium]|nr:cbb3-type cytochrome c oxidase subunit I [Burkholderiaceae bacterium]
MDTRRSLALDAKRSPHARPALPNPLPRPPGELTRLEAAWKPPRGWRKLASVNNFHVGLLYIGTALLFLLLAGVLGLVMRTQLAVPENTLLSERLYNQVFTMHGTVMMFLFAVPIIEAIGVFLLPGMLGARDLPFPRLSAYAYWAYAFGATVFFATLFFDAAPDGGWFMYPPLTGKVYSPGIGADFWLLGIGFIEISAIAGAIELIVGILFTRAPGMTLARMPVYAWAMLVTGFMIVFAFPAVIVATALLELERAFDWPFFVAGRGGDPLLWQHLFWFFGHPDVYIIFLPAAGLVSMMLPVVARRRLAGRAWIVAAFVAVGALSFALWLHHMFSVGLGWLSLAVVSAASILIAIPTAVQVFAWIATVWQGRLRITPAALFLLGFFALFVLGGLTGVMLAVLPFDWLAHDSYFVVAHLHYVLIGGTLFPVIAALYHWFPLVNGHALDPGQARRVFALMIVGFTITFLPMHVTGLLGMPRRVATYAPDLGWDGWNLASTLGAYVLAAGIALLLFDVVRTLRRPARAHADPWRGATLEWLPGGAYGSRSIPDVRSGDPLWAQPGLAAEVAEGRHWLPGTITGARETLVTSVRKARLSHLIVLPGDSWLPIAAAAGTAGFFLLLTAGAGSAAFAAGAGGVAAAVTWLWQLDRSPAMTHARIGAGVDVPIGARGRASHAWWGTVVLVLVDAIVFASLLYAHVHVSMLAPVCPPPGAALPDPRSDWIAAGLLAAGSAAIVMAGRALERRAGRARPAAWIVLATLATAASFGVALHAHALAGLSPRAQAWSATVAALLGTQGLHALLVALMG